VFVAKWLAQTLHNQGGVQRRIAQELGINRESVARYLKSNSKPASAPTGFRSSSRSFEELILAKLEQGLSAQRIFQDLVQEHDLGAQYHSVRRFVAKLRTTTP